MDDDQHTRACVQQWSGAVEVLLAPSFRVLGTPDTPSLSIQQKNTSCNRFISKKLLKRGLRVTDGAGSA